MSEHDNQPETAGSAESLAQGESRMQVISRYVTCSLLLLVGLAMAGYGGSLVYRGLSSSWWPTAVGEVLRTDVSIPTFNRLGNREGQRIRPVVEYRYQVDGEYYESSRLGLGPVPVTRTTDDAQAAVDRLLNADGTVTVFYRADDPSVALIDPRAPSTGILLLVVGAALALLSAMGWMWYYRNRKTSQSIPV